MNWETVIAAFWDLYFRFQETRVDSDDPGCVEDGQVDTTTINQDLDSMEADENSEEVLDAPLSAKIKRLEEELQFLKNRLDILRPARAEIIQMTKQYGSAPQEADKIRELWAWTLKEIKSAEDDLDRLLKKLDENSLDADQTIRSNEIKDIIEESQRWILQMDHDAKTVSDRCAFLNNAIRQLNLKYYSKPQKIYKLEYSWARKHWLGYLAKTTGAKNYEKAAKEALRIWKEDEKKLIERRYNSYKDMTVLLPGNYVLDEEDIMQMSKMADDIRRTAKHFNISIEDAIKGYDI